MIAFVPHRTLSPHREKLSLRLNDFPGKYRGNDRGDLFFQRLLYKYRANNFFSPRCRIRLLWKKDRVGRYSVTGGRKTFDMRGSIGTFGDAARPGQGQEVTESKTVSCIGMPFIGFR